MLLLHLQVGEYAIGIRLGHRWNFVWWTTKKHIGVYTIGLILWNSFFFAMIFEMRIMNPWKTIVRISDFLGLPDGCFPTKRTPLWRFFDGTRPLALEGYTSTCWCCWSLRLAFWHPENLAKLVHQFWDRGVGPHDMLRFWLLWHCHFCWALAEKRRYHQKMDFCAFLATASFFRWFVQEIDRALPRQRWIWWEFWMSNERIGPFVQVVLCC